MKTLSKLLALIVLAFGALFVVTPPSAFACSCAMGDMESSGDMADAVAVGKFTAVPTVENYASGNIDTPMTVLKVFKGSIESEVLVSVGGNGAMCGWTPQQDQEYLMFLREGADGAYRTGLCSNNVEYTESVEKEATTLWGDTTAPEDTAKKEDVAKKLETTTPVSDNTALQIVVWSSIAFATILCLFGVFFVSIRRKANKSENDLPQ